MFYVKLGLTKAVPSERSGVVLVISPLVLLMIDQVSGLQKRGVPVGILTGKRGSGCCIEKLCLVWYYATRC